MSFLGSYVDLMAFIPSSINQNNYINNPESAAFTWKNSKGFEDSKRGVFGASWNHEYSDNSKLITSVFTSFRKAYEARPFNILQENTFDIGIRSRLLANSKLFNKNLKWTFEGELFKDTNNYETFENLYEEFPNDNGSAQGESLSDFKERRNYYNVFAETNYELSEKTTFSFGLNLNKTAYQLKDNFPISDANLDQTGSYNFIS